ncbi:TonB-dependent receptor [Novosphingobium flavum]|uniref:TonB-dependent receptor n=1 Tax=Novosphingobium flavum TaxID=1778672 RepID=A0A7X1FRB4_9SPHN|nr:TonB-dependent receptor [Novosphingobium flavum]MBC2665539.1 TonB-dependent receptor [Novosphingobium flavum]
MIDMRGVLCTLLAGSSMVGLCAPAWAQAANAAPEASAEQPADIIVTGSRTIANGNNSPTPVTVVTTDSLQNVRPASLTDSLQVLPVFSGSRGLSSNPSATGTTGGGNGTAAQLNLRNIGAQRNLVLMDGRRVPPTSFTNIVDADVIPQMLIKRVDLVTGGVSAVYGSDAVSGVVNFITDTGFNGLKAQAQAGISSRSDDATHEIGLAWGTRIGESSHFEISYEFRDDAGISRRSDREWFNRTVIAGNGTTVPYFAIPYATLPSQPFGGRITCGATCAINGQYFASNGVLSPLVTGTTYAGTTTQSGGPGGYYDTALKAALNMHQVFARFDTDLSDNIHAFALVGANFKRNRFAAEDVLLSSVTLSRSNVLLSPTYAAQMPSATFTLGEMFNQNARLDVIADSRQITASAGLTGKFGGASWSLDYTHGDARLTTVVGNNLNNQKLSAALDAVAGPNGPVCYAATQAATAAAYANCVPLNLFGPSAASAAATDYIFDDTRSVSSTRQDDVNASISGSPFDTWAGPVAMALSGEYRSQSFDQTSDGTPSMVADCTNLRWNCTTASATTAATPLLVNTFAPSPKISMNVWEAAIEATVPLLKDVPFAANLDVTGAARYTKYNTVGGYATWKGGFNWAINDDLRFRGTISRDIRAPTLYDLFGPTTVSYNNYTDTKTNTSAFLPQFNQSNSGLTAEIGHTKTIGAVYKPHFVPGLSFAVDYYDINITNAIVTLQGTAAQIQSGCNNAGVQLYCDLIVRNSSGVVVNYIQKPINLARIRTSGVDFEVNYQGQLFGRPLSLRGLAAYQPHIRYIQPSVPTIDQGGVAFGSNGITASPSWRLTGTLSYKLTDAIRIDLMERWRNRLAISGDPTVTFAPDSGTIRPYAQTSVNVSVSVAPHYEFFFNVQNLFDAAPPAANLTGTAGTPGQRNGFASTDDVVGRYFVAGVKIKM